MNGEDGHVTYVGVRNTKIKYNTTVSLLYLKQCFRDNQLIRSFQSAFRIRIHPDPLHLAGSGSTSIPAPDPDPDPDPLRFLSSDPDPLKKALIWIRVTPKLFRVKSKTKCFCYLRNAFSKFWR